MSRPNLAEFTYLPHLITLLLIGLGFLGYRYFAYYDTRTNDAYVSANVINMAAIVSGPITAIYVKENQAVKKNDKLIEVDPRPYVYAVEKAKARLNLAIIHNENNQLAVEVATEQLKKAKFILDLKKQYFSRYQQLQTHGDLSKIALLDTEAKMHEQEATVLAAMQELKIAEKNFDNSEIQAAKAELAEAVYLNNHTTLLAPQDGFITNFNVRQGQYIKAGEGLFALVESGNWWILCRYRETSIRLIKLNDKAKITLDMYPGKTFHGHVISIGWGINRVQSGSVAESTLPFLEATEDWIKIAQRFPVRIAIDDLNKDYPLRIGASAVTTTYR